MFFITRIICISILTASPGHSFYPDNSEKSPYRRHVSRIHGNDTDQCGLKSTTPCKSLSFAVSQISSAKLSSHSEEKMAVKKENEFSDEDIHMAADSKFQKHGAAGYILLKDYDIMADEKIFTDIDLSIDFIKNQNDSSSEQNFKRSIQHGLSFNIPTTEKEEPSDNIANWSFKKIKLEFIGLEQDLWVNFSNIAMKYLDVIIRNTSVEIRDCKIMNGTISIINQQKATKQNDKNNADFKNISVGVYNTVISGDTICTKSQCNPTGALKIYGQADQVNIIDGTFLQTKLSININRAKSINLKNNLFSNDLAYKTVMGGAQIDIANTVPEVSITVENCRFENQFYYNPVDSVLNVYSAALRFKFGSSTRVNCSLVDTMFTNNERALTVQGSTNSIIQLTRTTFKKNVCVQAGAALLFIGGQGKVLNSSFIDNAGGFRRMDSFVDPNNTEVMTGSGPDEFILSTEMFKGTMMAVGKGGAIRVQAGTLRLEGSRFENNTALKSGGAVYVDENSTLEIINSNFSNAPRPSFTADQGGILFSTGRLTLDGLRVGVTWSSDHTSLIQHNGQPWSVQVRHLSVLCQPGHRLRVVNATSMKVAPEVGLRRSAYMYDQLAYYCTACPRNKYSLDQGRLVYRLDDQASDYYFTLMFNGSSPDTTFHGIYEYDDITCYNCPYGGSCEKGVITSLPNFWGYEYPSSRVRFQVCPRGYCCPPGALSCPSHQACAPHRKGRLCGRCSEGYTVAFFATRCVKDSSCSIEGIAGMTLLLGLLYALFLFYQKSLREFIFTCQNNYSPCRILRQEKSDKETENVNSTEQILLSPETDAKLRRTASLKNTLNQAPFDLDPCEKNNHFSRNGSLKIERGDHVDGLENQIQNASAQEIHRDLLSATNVILFLESGNDCKQETGNTIATLTDLEDANDREDFINENEVGCLDEQPNRKQKTEYNYDASASDDCGTMPEIDYKTCRAAAERNYSLPNLRNEMEKKNLARNINQKFLEQSELNCGPNGKDSEALTFEFKPRVKRNSKTKTPDKTKSVPVKKSTVDIGSIIMVMIMYYFQDATLFYVRTLDQDEESNARAALKKILLGLFQFRLEVSHFVDNVCLLAGMQFPLKLLTKTIVIPYCLLLFGLLYIGHKILCLKRRFLDKQKLKCEAAEIDRSRDFMCKLSNGFILALLFTYQRLAETAFTLLNCVEVKNVSVLFTDGETECYQPWQYIIMTYTFCCVLLFPVVFMFGPRLLRSGKIHLSTFFVGCLLPPPFLLMSVLRFFLPNSRKGKYKNGCLIEAQNEFHKDSNGKPNYSVGIEDAHNQNNGKYEENGKDLIANIESGAKRKSNLTSEANVNACQDIAPSSSKTPLQSDIAPIEKEHQNHSEKRKKDVQITPSAQTVLGVLDGPFREIRLPWLNTRICWAGFIIFRRSILVLLFTFINQNLVRVTCMMVVLFLIFCHHGHVRPYKDSRANTAGSGSIGALLIVGGINLLRAGFEAAEYIPRGPVKTLSIFINGLENLLMFWVPLIFMTSMLVIITYKIFALIGLKLNQRCCSTADNSSTI